MGIQIRTRAALSWEFLAQAVEDGHGVIAEVGGIVLGGREQGQYVAGEVGGFELGTDLGR